MSTLRVSNIEAKADPSSPSVDEKLKVTNSNGDVLIHIDGKTAGITTVGINTTDKSFTVDAAQNVEFLGIVTATKFSLSGGGEITGGDGNFTGIVTSGSGNFTGGLSVGTAVTAATANFTSSLTAASANFTGNVSIAGTLTYEDVTNVDSIGIATARTGIDVTGGHIDIIDNSKIRVGTGDDLQIYHDGSNSYIDDTGTGRLNIRGNTGVSLRNYSNSNQFINCYTDGTVELFFNNNKKFETTTTGAKVTGALEVTQEYPSIRPTLDLNFAATKTLDRRITFTRDSLGTYYGENGLVKYASNNVPRFDHDSTTGESLGLLIEESRTNKFTTSSTIGGTGWTQQGTAADYTLNTTEVAAPDGTFTALKWHPSAIPQYLYQNLSNIGTTQSTMSVWVRCPSGQSRTFFMNLYSPSQNGGAGQFTATDQWQRFTWTFTPQSQANVYPIVPDSTGIYYIWAPQLEEGSFATSYIPTSGSTVTRAQDFAKITGTNFTDFYNQQEGTLVCDQSVSNLGTANQYSVILSSDVNESIGMGYRVGGGASGNYGFYVIKSGDALFRNVTANITANTPYKTALAYELNNGGTCFNGETSVTDTSLSLPTPDRMLIGEGYSANNEMTKGHIRKISYYNKRLPNAQLQGLTQQ